MATKDNIALTEEWALLGTGPLTATIISGASMWFFVADSAPTDDDGYTPIEGKGCYLSYGGSQKVYGKLGVAESSINTTVGVLEVR